MADQALESFGRTLMTKVRDESIWQWKNILNGHIKGESSEAARTLLATGGPKCERIVLTLLPQVVDTVLHHLLWTLEQTENMSVVVQAGEEQVDIKDLSDGLAGELYGKQGWIAKFSKEVA